MKNLPFEKVAQIEQVCSNLPLDGLVLILTGQDRNGGALIYLDPKPLFTLPDEWQARELSELQDEDFLTWDGLAIGYDPLNLHFQLLLTQGVNFYSIRHLYASLNRLDVYRENARKLALWLYQNKIEANPSDRFSIKLIELLAPSCLESNHPASSVGLAFNSPDLLPFLTKEKQPKWVTLANLENDPSSVSFLLTFDEIKQIIPSLAQCPHVVEWRPILWKNEKQDLLIDALDETAQIFWEQAEKRTQPQLRRQAYAFALERWLAQTDTEHLVAVFPDGNFENFLKTGSSVFIKQMPKIYISAEPQQEFFTLIDLLNRDRKLQDTIGKAYGGTPFCIQPFLKVTQALTSSDSWSLEQILYAVGKAPSLSATFLSLVNDFIHYEDINNAQFSAEQIRDIALRGTYLLASGDPWNQAWRGRFSLLLDQAYSILDDAFLYDEKARQSQASPLLRAWHGLYREKNLSRRWNELQRLKQEFFEKVSGQEEYILHVLAGQRIPDAETKQIRDLQVPVLWEGTMPILTGDFLRLYHAWREIHRERTTIEQNLLHTSPSTQKIEQMLNEYRRIQRCLYALPHEVTVLKHLCSKDVEALTRLQSALKREVALQIHFLTNKIFRDEETRLLFEVENIGSQDAQNIELSLQDSPQYKIIGENKSRYISNLPAHTGGYRLEWRVLTQSDEALYMRLESNLFKPGANDKESFEFDLPVIHKGEKTQGPRGGNPFQAGVAVDGEKFFGRQKELKSIFDILLYRTTQPILLRGPRRMGKTSILHQIGHFLNNPGELQKRLGYSSENEMQFRLAKPVFTTLQGTTSEKEIVGWYFDLYKKILEVTGTDLEFPIERIAFDADDPDRVFARYISRFLENRRELQLVILLDEWDEQRHLAKLGDKLRALIQTEKRLNWVISSTWMLSAEHGRFSSPFYAQTRAFELKEMPWEEAKNMVETLSELVGITWQSDALVTLLDQTALRPYLIQALGQRIYESLSSAKTPFNVVDMKTIQAVISDFVRGTRSQGSHFAFLWNDEAPSVLESDKPEARLSWLGRLILLTMEENTVTSLQLMEILNFLHDRFQEKNISTPGGFDDDVADTLDELELIFDAIKKEGDRYTFGVPLAQAWFHNAIRQYDDPWQFALGQFQKEYKKSRRANKEQR